MSASKPRAIFFGTPEIAVPSLEALGEIADVVFVTCQPDKPVGRHQTLTAPPVKTRALALGIPVEQPAKLRTGEFGAKVKAASADFALVIAYGRILPDDVLAGPRLGCLNLHASILPHYRGAAPIQWAVARGESETGITLMQMDAGLDTGPMLETWRTKIDRDETAGELGVRLGELAARAVREGVKRFLAGELAAKAQDEEKATFAPILTKDHGKIEWNAPAALVHAHVRGMNPWPLGQTTVRGKRILVHRTRLVESGAATHAPGTVILADKSRIVVACASGAVELVQVQLEGKKPIRGADWFLGRGVAEGDVLGG
ncbi:methionyl-tRNA formyltransferase [soil metagenome]